MNYQDAHMGPRTAAAFIRLNMVGRRTVNTYLLGHRVVVSAPPRRGRWHLVSLRDFGALTAAKQSPAGVKWIRASDGRSARDAANSESTQKAPPIKIMDGSSKFG